MTCFLSNNSHFSCETFGGGGGLMLCLETLELRYMYINCFVPASAISKTSEMHGYMIFIINIIN